MMVIVLWSWSLGKTFMSNCIAKALLDMNKIVIYQTAFKILEIIERRFSRDTNRFDDYEYDLLFSSDLLIIDDLGSNYIILYCKTFLYFLFYYSYEIFSQFNSKEISPNLYR